MKMRCTHRYSALQVQIFPFCCKTRCFYVQIHAFQVLLKLENISSYSHAHIKLYHIYSCYFYMAVLDLVGV